jgi:hypothetical protein
LTKGTVTNYLHCVISALLKQLAKKEITDFLTSAVAQYSVRSLSCRHAGFLSVPFLDHEQPIRLRTRKKFERSYHRERGRQAFSLKDNKEG